MIETNFVSQNEELIEMKEKTEEFRIFLNGIINYSENNVHKNMNTLMFVEEKQSIELFTWFIIPHYQSLDN